MKIYQTALAVALSLSSMAKADEDTCVALIDYACTHDGFTEVCKIMSDMDLSAVQTAFLPTDEALTRAEFSLLDIDSQKDIIDYHFASTQANLGCGELLEMMDSKDSRTLCESDIPMYQKGPANLKTSPPKFNVTDGIPVCGDAMMYTVDQVMLPREYTQGEKGAVTITVVTGEEVYSNATQAMYEDYYLYMLTAKSGADDLSAQDRDDVCAGSDPKFESPECDDEAFTNLGQAGANVTKGYEGEVDVGDLMPITDPYYKTALCPVNVHWHKGAEHYSAGEFDCTDYEKCGPTVKSAESATGRKLADDVPIGFQCNHYDPDDEKFTKPFDWQFCVNMEVGQTYEVHWPHSAFGACGTPNQYQTPFKDGVFCHLPKDDFIGVLSSPGGAQAVASNVGVQAQIFTVVNDEEYYYENLFGGMIVDGDMGVDMAIYTGSTTGSRVNNDICSPYTPITWQVDRKCHLVSASSFDKMCSRMLAQRDDMRGDLYPHGSRILVADNLAADNQQSRKKNLRA